MDLDLLKELQDHTKTLFGPDFKFEVTRTDTVPDFEDPGITYEDLDANVKKCKLLESCVLYVDIRDSSRVSSKLGLESLAQIYSAFVSSMCKAADHFQGNVRNIIGDRVMVLFDREQCFANSVNTAILFNSISQHVLAKQFKDFKCGIGIDFGHMLVTKAGTRKLGTETEFYRSLVWLGNPANVASKLTDVANKRLWETKNRASVGLHYPNTDYWEWLDKTCDEFIADLEPSYTRSLTHKNEHFTTFQRKPVTVLKASYKPILMTKRVLDGFKKEVPDHPSIRNRKWTHQSPVPGCDDLVFGGDVVFDTA